MTHCHHADGPDHSSRAPGTDTVTLKSGSHFGMLPPTISTTARHMQQEHSPRGPTSGIPDKWDNGQLHTLINPVSCGHGPHRTPFTLDGFLHGMSVTIAACKWFGSRLIVKGNGHGFPLASGQIPSRMPFSLFHAAMDGGFIRHGSASFRTLLWE